MNDSLDVAEQLAFEQPRRQRRAMDPGRTADLARGLAAWMARANNSLPVPLSPRIKHGRPAGGDLADDVEHPPDRFARPPDLLEDARVEGRRGIELATRPADRLAAVVELILEDQDAAALLGDLVDLVAELQS